MLIIHQRFDVVFSLYYVLHFFKCLLVEATFIGWEKMCRFFDFHIRSTHFLTPILLLYHSRNVVPCPLDKNAHHFIFFSLFGVYVFENWKEEIPMFISRLSPFEVLGPGHMRSFFHFFLSQQTPWFSMYFLWETHKKARCVLNI